MTKRVRSPQEKKVLSYAKDGRNPVAEARSKSRISIAKRKAGANQALRRAEKVAISKLEPFAEDSEVMVSRTGRRSFRKVPDAPLAEYVGRTLNRRADNGMNATSKKSDLLQQGKKRAPIRVTFYKGTLQKK
ncbi:MAG: hypothetical protein LBE50_00035 [Gallionellaceae bacterium]|jgi:hypothetical protein|nr:hypothetical protein [Gallionellaceae bacterium]